MSVRKKRCRICRGWFMPDARTARFQKVCGAALCRDERRRRANADWWAKNKDYDSTRQGKKRAWAQDYPHYWKTYRRGHSDYVAVNRKQTQARMKASRLVFANQDAIRKDPVGYLQGLKPPGMFANQDTIGESVDGILTFLVQKERFANQDAIDSRSPTMASSSA